MKSVNLLSLSQTHGALSDAIYSDLLALYTVEIRNAEANDLKGLVEVLRGQHLFSRILDGFHVGYKIPQIGKEFDLLRFGQNFHINIELKSDCDVIKMQRQLLRNKYYLNALEVPAHNFSFSSLTRQIYYLNADDQLEAVAPDFLADALRAQDLDLSTPIESLFSPSSYLVSPFNSPEKFLASEYFLTTHQENIKNQIEGLLGNDGAPVFISLTGAAGTGKTLLAYDIVASAIAKGKTPLVVHCGNLNDGHRSLCEAGWNVIPAKSLRYYHLSNFDFLLIDEAQRLYPHQFTSVITLAQAANGKCIFAYDKSQTLADQETRNDLSGKIESIPGVSKFSLSEKIRTNKEISNFLKSFFNISRGLKAPNTGNIQLIYFTSGEDAKDYLHDLDEEHWKVIRFTPSQYNTEYHERYSNKATRTSHEIIGQEFDAVAVAIDKFFSHDSSGVLIYSGNAYYQPAKMLFQNMTRARNKLKLIIIDNPEVLKACLGILQ